MWQEPSGTPPGPSGRNFIQIIIWISLCSVTASPCQFERLSCQFERSREHVLMYTSQWHLASLLDSARSDTSRDLSVAISFRLSSEFHCAQWPQVLVSSSVSHVSSSVVENTCVCTRRNDIWLRISTTLDVTRYLVSSSGLAVSSSVVENTSQWHQGSHLERIAARYSRCDILRAERRPNLSVAISFRLSSEFHCARCDIRLSVRALLHLIC
jgi:hypothetical protein